MTGLKNKIFAITRNEQDAVEFTRLVVGQGGRAIALPTIEVVPKGPGTAKEFIEILRKEKQDYCAFMSAQAVNVLFDLLSRDKILQALGSTRVIAVGPKTRASLEKYGVKVSHLPAKFSSVGLAEMLAGMQPSGKRIIIPRSDAAGEYAVNALAALGMNVKEVLLYSVRTSPPSPVWSEFSSLLSEKKVSAIVFTSASSVRSFFEIMGMLTPVAHLGELAKVVSIGPFTSRELKNRNIAYHETDEHTVKGAFEVARRLV
ncbi:MAG: uroporphyrinogen-III synthase [Nitrososphaera sp.]